MLESRSSRHFQCFVMAAVACPPCPKCQSDETEELEFVPKQSRIALCSCGSADTSGSQSSHHLASLRLPPRLPEPGTTMPTLACPTCQHQTPRTVEEPTAISQFNYYRCDVCGTVWHVPKADPYGPFEIVAIGIRAETPPD